VLGVRFGLRVDRNIRLYIKKYTTYTTRVTPICISMYINDAIAPREASYISCGGEGCLMFRRGKLIIICGEAG